MFLNNSKKNSEYKTSSGKDPHTIKVDFVIKGKQYNENDPLGDCGYWWNTRIGGWVKSMYLLETIDEIKERVKDGIFKDKKIVPRLIAHNTKDYHDVYFFVKNVFDDLY